MQLKSRVGNVRCTYKVFEIFSASHPSTHQTYPVSSNGVRLVSGYVLRFLKQVRYNSKLKLYFWKKWSEQLSLTVHQRTV